jgi:hypothetical protein
MPIRQFPSPVRFGKPAPHFISHGRGGVAGGAGGGNFNGSGSPEGVVAADVDSVYVQTDRSAIWYKVTGAGNTGWERQAKSTTGVVDPNGSVFGSPGDQYLDTATGTRYTKGSGNDTNTGWV